MKKILLSIIMGCIALISFSQKDNPDCFDKTFKFFTPFDGFYLDYCNYAEFGSYEFMVDRGARSIKKEGIYREVWFRKKQDNNRKVSSGNC